MELQTILALLIVFAVVGRFVYTWLKKRKQKTSGSCGCDNDGCE